MEAGGAGAGQMAGAGQGLGDRDGKEQRGGGEQGSGFQFHGFTSVVEVEG